MKRTGSQGTVGSKIISPKSKQKMRKTIRSALGRQNNISHKIEHDLQVKGKNKNGRSSSTKSLKQFHHQSAVEYENSSNFLRKMSEKKLNIKPENSRLRKIPTQQSSSSPVTSKCIQFHNFQLKPSRTVHKTVSSYEWWHSQQLQIQTQQRIKRNEHHEEYLTYFACANSSKDKIKKKIIVAVENHTMYPGDPNLAIFALKESKQEPHLQVQQVPYHSKIQLDHEKFGYYLLCGSANGTDCFVNKQSIKMITGNPKILRISEFMGALVKKRIQEGEGSLFYLLIKISNMCQKSKIRDELERNQSNKQKKMPKKMVNRQLVDVSSEALWKFKKGHRQH